MKSFDPDLPAALRELLEDEQLVRMPTSLMVDNISRRTFHRSLGCFIWGFILYPFTTKGVIMAYGKSKNRAEGQKPWIHLRPYHPTYVISYLGKGLKDKHKGFLTVINKIKAHPDLEVEMVEGYDDVCLECEQRSLDPDGSVWGIDSTCPSAQDPRTVADVYRSYMKMLEKLDLEFGSVISMRELTTRLEERVPILDHPMIGGPDHQASYEVGLKILSRLYTGR